jgi:SAM-dependent methyltransferase
MMIGRLWLEGIRLGVRILPSEPVLGLKRLALPVNYWRSVEFSYAWGSLNAERGARVLDVGSPKDLALFLARARGLTIQATDILEGAVSLAERYATAAGLTIGPGGHVECEVADGRALPYADSSFDAAYSVSVLEHIPDAGDTDAIKELVRVVKPGGRVVVTAPFDRQHRDTFVDRGVYERGFDGSAPVFFERHYDRESLQERLIRPSGADLVDLHFWGEGSFPTERWLNRSGALRTILSPLEGLLASISLRELELDGPNLPMAAFFTLSKPA